MISPLTYESREGMCLICINTYYFGERAVGQEQERLTVHLRTSMLFQFLTHARMPVIEGN